LPRPAATAPGQRWFCPAGHSFDIAREGYVNLLPARGKKQQSQGDSGEMLRARRRFLEAGHYDPLVSGLVEMITAVPPAPNFTILDAGCGEGFYLRRLAAAFHKPAPRLLGCDLAKEAVRLAAKAQPDAGFFVADVHQRIYCADSSVDWLLNIFAPRNPAEYARILREEGRLLSIIPAPDHLQGLVGKKDVIGIEPEKAAKVRARMAPFFELLKTTAVASPLQLAGESLVDLVKMTPRAYHLPAETYAALRQKPAVTTKLSVKLLLFRPKQRS
jgi:23S rRNA (guanine745-N1)-methyltransferase